MTDGIREALRLYGMERAEVGRIPAHDGGRNDVYAIRIGKVKYILRISALGDRTEEDYLAETEFVCYLAENGAPVAGVIPSNNGKLVERIEYCGKTAFACLFEYAPGVLISENGYRYRDGAPLAEYFYNTGKALGRIHALSKKYKPAYRRTDFFIKYNMEYIEKLIPDEYADLKHAMAERLRSFGELPKDGESYGLVHFDFNDGNYHIDMNSGKITVFDFDNSLYCSYMYDLADLWLNGEGWCYGENDPGRRRKIMNDYFASVLAGYRSETYLPDDMLDKLPLFIDIVLIENIVDEIETCLRSARKVVYADIEDAADCQIRNLKWAGIFGE